MRRVQYSSPEDPDALPADVEERHNLQPPGLVASSHTLEAWFAKLFIAPEKSRRCESRGHNRPGLRLARQANELPEEAALGEELVLHDIGNAAGAFRRFEGHV